MFHHPLLNLQPVSLHLLQIHHIGSMKRLNRTTKRWNHHCALQDRDKGDQFWVISSPDSINEVILIPCSFSIRTITGCFNKISTTRRICIRYPVNFWSMISRIIQFITCIPVGRVEIRPSAWVRRTLVQLPVFYVSCVVQQNMPVSIVSCPYTNRSSFVILFVNFYCKTYLL